jgi:Predicted pyridoxal phosphate-dependent enzyme apparently involved in regulation of cell wall biogenesis
VTVSFLDLKVINAQYGDELVNAATQVIDASWYFQGQEVGAFQNNLTAYCGV